MPLHAAAERLSAAQGTPGVSAMTRLECNIVNFLRTNAGAWTTAEIAKRITAHGTEVQSALHDLDDNGWVTMKNGLYQASAKALS